MKKLLIIIFFFATLTAFAAPIPRYFLISYAYSKGNGTIGVSSTTYPSKTGVRNMLRKKYVDPTMNIVILNIMEFKTKADFDYFFADKIYYDTIQTQKPLPPVVVTPTPTTERTLYFRDLGIAPNTGLCITDRVQQVIDSALALGGTTTLIISDSGAYNYTNAEQQTRGTASVTIDVGCYPDGKGILADVVVEPCL